MSSTTEIAGKKRKRYTPAEKDVPARLTGKLHHSFKEIRKSVKKAKIFETQRLVKRLKGLRKSTQNAEVTEEILDLEAQLEYLKRVDQERIAHIALSSKIRKDRALSSNDALNSALASVIITSTNPETQHTKVESRLLSSKILASEVKAVLDGLNAVLEPKVKIGDPTGSETYEAKEDREDEPNDDSDHETIAQGLSIATGDRNVAHGLDKLVDEADDMLDGDGWESGSIHPSDDEDSGSSDSASPDHPRKRSKHVSFKSRTALSEQDASEATSTFLPSLSVGFIKGGSESDFEELGKGVADTGKKNRRGQRARQAIWEKRYGKNAKHVKNRREETEAMTIAKKLGKRLDSGWNAARGPPGNSHSHRNNPPGSQSSLRTGTQATERPTHPSWEAKKKLKEKEGAKILPSQGKKIVF